MKLVNDFSLIIYSFFELSISIILIMMINGVVSTDIARELINSINSLENGSIIYTVVFTLIALLSIVSIFSTESEEDSKRGMAMEYEAGKVLLTKETFENIALSVVKKYGALKASKTSVKITQEGLIVNIYTLVIPDTVVSDLTIKVQKDIKETIAKLTTVKVQSVNIKVKGVYNEPVKAE
ncbi:MAG: alkaline shock response membrane anchor protein AmaP [Clostridia bacterium]